MDGREAGEGRGAEAREVTEGQPAGANFSEDRVDIKRANAHLLANLVIMQGVSDFLSMTHPIRDRKNRKEAIKEYFDALDDVIWIASHTHPSPVRENPNPFDDAIDSLDFTITAHKIAVRNLLTGKFDTVQEEERANAKAKKLIRIVGMKARETKRQFSKEWKPYHSNKYKKYLGYKA